METNQSSPQVTPEGDECDLEPEQQAC